MEWRLFEGIPGEDVRAVLSLARRSTYRRGEVVFHHHDPADAVHLVAKGRFDIRITTALGDVVALAIRGPGETFGELAVVTGAERSATVSALEAGETLVLRGSELRRLAREHPSVDEVLVRVLAEHVAFLSERLVESYTVDAETRVARRVLELGRVYGGSPPVTIPLIQEEIAALAGASRATVNRVLRDAEDRGFVELSRGRPCSSTRAGWPASLGCAPPMPEGDSLHRVAARLQALVGQRVDASSPSPRGLATGVARAVDGRVLESVEAIGKHLLLRFEGGVTVRSHLRMNGRWRVRERNGRAWSGSPWLVLSTPRFEATQWNGPVLTLDDGRADRLGPDLLAETTRIDDVVARLRAVGSGRLLGDVLVDQRVVSGIGNMWLAELLWRARLSPWLALDSATDDELEDGLTWARAAMLESVRGARSPRAVYRRAGRPCPRCGALVRSRGLGDANRTAYWCASCQRGP